MERLDAGIIFKSEHLSQNLAKKSINGGMISVLSQGIQFALRLAGTMILARLLAPGDYGVFGMVTVVVSFVAMFKVVGLSTATVQKEAISHEQISNLFWFNFLVSSFLAFLVLCCSPLVAKFYGREELMAVTAVLSISLIINGIMLQHEALLRRHMRFDILAVVQILSLASRLVVVVILALLGWRYWALVAGALVTAISLMLLTFYYCPWVPGPIVRGTGIRGMLKFGGHLTGVNFVSYFSRNADSILIGKSIGPEALGLYTKAYQLFLIPASQSLSPINQIAVPALSSLRNQPVRYVRYYTRILDVLATLTIPMTIYCAIEADFLIRVFLGAQWLGAVPVFRILSIAGLIQGVAGTRGLVLLSLGFSERYLIFAGVNAVVFVVAFIIGLPYGTRGVALGYTIASYLILFPSLYYCFSKTPVTVGLFIKTILPPLFMGLVSAGILIVGLFFVDSLAGHWFLGGVYAVAYAALSWLRPSVKETISLVLKGFPLSPAKSISSPSVG